MKEVSALLTLFSVIVLVFGALNVIYPWKSLKIRRRRTGAYIMLGSVLTLLLSAWQVGVRSDADAQAQGFLNTADEMEAKREGISDSKTWQPLRSAAVEEKAARIAKVNAEARASAALADEARRKRLDAEKAEQARIAADKEAAEKYESMKKEADCRQDLSCWGEKGVVTAGIFCKDRIEKLAKYDVRWTDSWYEMKFSKYKWSSLARKNLGIVTYIGDRAQFQNGFGAFQNVIYTCDLIPSDDGHVIYDVGVSPGRLQ